MVIVYNTSPPPRVSWSALALACCWVQNQLFDTRFMMAAKRPIWYTCTIQLVRDCKFDDWIKPLDVYGDLGLLIYFSVFVFLYTVRSLRQLISFMICSPSHRQRGVRLLLLVAGAVLVCVSLYIFRAFFCLFVFAFSLLFFFHFFPLHVFLLLFCRKLWRLTF